MIKINPYSIITGKNFSPSLVEKKCKITFSEKNEPGEIGKEGRFDGEKIPYGSAELSFSQESELIEMLTKNIDIFRSCGVEDIILHFDVIYKNQCNIEFDSEMLMKIANLNIPFTITCYEDDIEA